VPRRPLALLAVLAALAIATVVLTRAQAGPVKTGTRQVAVKPGDHASYLSAASVGIARSRAWWDKSRHWYRQRLGGDRRPATNWGIVHLFGAIDALAIADPTPAHRAMVRAFVRGAEHYWNPDLSPVPGYGPSPGNRGAHHRTWYDDEGWWGIAFYDAFRATGDRRYLSSADRALTFLDSGWDPKNGGIYWDTRRTFKSGESLAGATLLAAYLYGETRTPRYLAMASKYVAWADAGFRGTDGFYDKRVGDQTPMPYVEGTMAAAFAVLCHSTGDQALCTKAEVLADRTVKRFPALTMGPQYDAMYVRALLELHRLDGNRRWYDVAAAATDRAMANARAANGLYLRTWDGSSITTIGTRPGKLQTHAATTSVIAWMAAARPPN
jgi:uncharacterized protein YyaL (SSP411 family)